MTVVSDSYTAKDLIPITGYIHDRIGPNGRQLVEGFAFQVPGFEFFKTWVTPSLWRFAEGDWGVSHWETGYSIGQYEGVVGKTPEEAATKAAEFLKAKGVELCRQKLEGYGFSPSPTATVSEGS